MSTRKKMKVRGIMMLVPFFALLAIIFSPVFPGKINGLDYMDNLFNMISKGSSNFIPNLLKDSEKYTGQTIDVKFSMADEKQAADTAKLFEAGGATVAVSGKELNVAGDMGLIMRNCLEDSKNLFENNGTPLVEKYGYNERQVLNNWWQAFKAVGKALTAQESFAKAKTIASLQAKVIEPAYNYYGVDAGSYKEYFVLILAALAFYVIYTVWYGFGVMYLFEGLGLKVGH